MSAYTVEQWIFFFYFYCFFGWCFESTYVSIRKKRLVNRGFMRGPFLPLYGSGAMMMLIVSQPFLGIVFPWNVVCTYVAGCIGATALEYVTGVVMEALFKVRYWDYSTKKFQFQGHICLSSTLAWGGLTVFMAFFAHQFVERAVLSIPLQALHIVTIVMTACLAADFALSFKAAMDLRYVLDALDKIKQETNRMQRKLDMIVALAGEDVARHKEDISKYRQETAELMEKLRVNLADRERLSAIRDFFQRDMIRSNPTMISRHFGETLKELQEKLEQEIIEHRRKER